MNSPGSFLACIHAEFNVKFSMGGSYLTPAEVFSPKAFLPLLMFYALSRMWSQFGVDLADKVQMTDVEDGYFKKEVIVAHGLLEIDAKLKYVLAQLAVDLILNGRPLQSGMEVKLDELFDYFNAFPEERESMQWQPRHL